MNLAIIGSRTFRNYKYVSDTIKDKYNIQDISNIISGGAEGVDTLAAMFAKENNINLIEYIPDWNRYGNKAAFIRNELIINSADEVLAFWDGKSKGTMQSIKIAKNKNKKITIFYEII